MENGARRVFSIISRIAVHKSGLIIHPSKEARRLFSHSRSCLGNRVASLLPDRILSGGSYNLEEERRNVGSALIINVKNDSISWRRAFSADAKSSKVVTVSSDTEYKRLMEEIADKDTMAVVDFTATWCGPCRRIAPILEEYSNTYSDVTFLKVDIDEEDLQETVKAAGITAVPTFVFYKGSKNISQFAGGDPSKLQDMIKLLRQT